MLPRICLAIPALLLAGCAGLSDLRKEHVAAPAPPSNESIQAVQLARYIGDLQTVVQGSPTEQAEVMASARAGYDQAKQGPAALRFGLLLAAPAHPARDPVQAQRLLREALARPELLNILERGLALVELQRVEAELRLTTEGERLLAELQRERERQRTVPNNTALTRRLQTEIEENARLRKALDEAKAKLDAIATIERNISDRPPGAPAAPANEGRNP
jgi:hypothetical protein